MAQRMGRIGARGKQAAGKSRGHWHRESHARHRDYSPTLGRFIERDPIGFEAGDNNWYRFVANGPTGNTDGSGLWSWDGDWIQMGVGGLLGFYGADVAAEGWSGTGHGAAMIANAATFHQIDSIDSYVDNVVQTNGGLYGCADAFAHAGVYVGYAAAGTWAWGAAGMPTFGAGVVTTSETSVMFQLNAQLHMGTSSGVITIPAGTGWAQMGYWTSITGVPILNAEAALAGAGSTLWLPNHPCASRALQAWVCGYAPRAIDALK